MMRKKQNLIFDILSHLGFEKKRKFTITDCRQKTTDFVASCKSRKRDKPCTIKYCRKCLLNRYGEKKQEVDLLNDWKCPKCRGICNCSICMKKRGFNPTGPLVHTAKASGFSSVSELIHFPGPDNSGSDKILRNFANSPQKSVNPNEEIVVIPSGKHVKENSVDENSKEKKTKWEGLTEICNGNKGYDQGSRRDVGVLTNVKINNADDMSGTKKIKCTANSETEEIVINIPLPQGTSLTNISGIELPPENVGHALQFLEFCAVFGKALDVKKGEPEDLLQELIHRESGGHDKTTAVDHIHIKLLSIVQMDSGIVLPSLNPADERNVWFQALRKVLSGSVLKQEWQLDFLGDNEYDDLELSNKLRILNFLCDEALGTEKLRNFIDKENTIFLEGNKEARDKVHAAKNKKKLLKQKLQDEMAQPHAELLEAQKKVSKKRKTSAALRSELVLMDANGHFFWTLKSYSAEDTILMQDMKILDGVACDERWFTYGAGQRAEIEKYISFSRVKRLRIQNVLVNSPSGSNEMNSPSGSNEEKV
ncbi:Zinc-finger domain of monoamine-oxidase A repressor R1 protein [Quillaja saponaria]|uniref:Zinc-finger domain of monoamine-oxidase A repressor R1 protein n=1 Tax=Quillaja saponaria TaxID=32244 RepID=A0AAD7PXY7_QUISA|nr:Zinc-finger domain of monoamine-oxidase A repressor R1 protein [Quillaja saponaria]